MPEPDRTDADASGPRFDLELFLQLNREYEREPVLRTVRGQDTDSQVDHAAVWAERVDKRVGLRGQRVLEIGCGRGAMGKLLAEKYDCQVVGLDIRSYQQWRELEHPNVQRFVHDVAEGPGPLTGQFDRIISLVVWEHVRHPFSSLKTCRQLLRPDGRFYLRANLYRGSLASHRYEDVFFPWPHLLFSHDVFMEFYRHIGKRSWGPSWVNKLSYADYRRYFELLGLSVTDEWLTRRPLDRDFYERFETQLGKYPEFDLTLEFFDAVLAPDEAGVRGQALRHTDARAFAVAERLARKPRTLKYWLTMPWDMVRIALRKHD